MTEIILRNAVESDSRLIIRLIHDAGINPTGLDWHRFIVAEDSNQQFLGCGQLKPHGKTVMEMASIAVIPSARGQGIARLIIEYFVKTAPRPLFLTCRSQLGTFYSKFGFRVASETEIPAYFKRITRFSRIAKALHLIHVNILVMILN